MKDRRQSFQCRLPYMEYFVKRADNNKNFKMSQSISINATPEWFLLGRDKQVFIGLNIMCEHKNQSYEKFAFFTTETSIVNHRIFCSFLPRLALHDSLLQ